MVQHAANRNEIIHESRLNGGPSVNSLDSSTNGGERPPTPPSPSSSVNTKASSQKSFISVSNYSHYSAYEDKPKVDEKTKKKEKVSERRKR